MLFHNSVDHRILNASEVMALRGEMDVHQRRGRAGGSVWARPGMSVTFRAELMPGRSAAERTFRIARMLPSRRVLVDGITGEHTAAEFETMR